MVMVMMMTMIVMMIMMMMIMMMMMMMMNHDDIKKYDLNRLLPCMWLVYSRCQDWTVPEPPPWN